MPLQLHVPSIVCEGCADTLITAIQTLDPAAVVTVDLPSKTLTIASTSPIESIHAAITDKGHTFA